MKPVPLDAGRSSVSPAIKETCGTSSNAMVNVATLKTLTGGGLEIGGEKENKQHIEAVF